MYKPKKAKYIKLEDDKISAGSITPKIVKKLVEDALTGNTGKWSNIVNDNSNGLLFKEYVSNKEEL